MQKKDKQEEFKNIKYAALVFFNLLLLLDLNIAHADALPSKLDVVDYNSYVWFSGDADYLYGLESPNYVSRMNNSGQVSTGKVFYYLTPPSGTGHYRILNIFSTGIAVPGKGNIVFVMAQDDASLKHYLFKSVDSGMNFGTNPPNYNNNQYVFMFGDTNGTVANQIAYVRTLENRGFCVADAGGAKTFFVGEYNANPSRIKGALNDQVRLMKSTDNGDTWTEVAHFNTDGATTQIRHIHTVRQDPYSKNIYIGTGDLDNECGVIIWDGMTDLSSNSYTDFAIRGKQRYRAVDFIFTENNMFVFSDTSSPQTECGIWKASKDLASYDRVDTAVKDFPFHLGWFGLRTTEGTLLFIDSTFTASDFQLNVFASGDNGNTWKIVGKYGAPTSTFGIRDFFERNGKIYISGQQASGKNTYGATAIASLQGDFTEEEPVILHPVYWVAPNGSDTTSGGWGWQPSKPWASLKYALEGDRICRGARVIVNAGTYTTNGIIPDWDANPRPGTGAVIVEGAGRDSTAIYNTANDSSPYLLYAESQEGRVIYKNMKFYSAKNISSTSCLVKTMTGSKVEFRDCMLGDPNYEVSGICLLAGGTVTVQRSILEQPDTATQGRIIYTTGTGSTFQGFYSIFKGGATQIDIQSPEVNALMYNCDFTGFRDAGMVIQNSATVVPRIKNCIFSHYNENAYAINDLSGLSETDTDINHNNYYGTLTVAALTNAGGTNSIIANPDFVDPAQPDYHLLSYSPCINEGINVFSFPIIKDFAGEVVSDGHPDMGAYEYGNTISTDTDNDGILNGQDNCPNSANPGQEDKDADGVGDVCDSDTLYGSVNGSRKAGILIQLYAPSCGGDTLIATTTTNAEGYYAFGPLQENMYKIKPIDSSCSFNPSIAIKLTIPRDVTYTSTDFASSCQ